MPLRKEEIYFKNKYLSTLARLFIIFQLPVSVNSSLINHTAASECIWPCGGLVKTSKPASGCGRKMIKQCLDILKQNPCVSLEYSDTHTCLRARWRVRGTLTSEAHSHLGGHVTAVKVDPHLEKTPSMEDRRERANGVMMLLRGRNRWGFLEPDATTCIRLLPCVHLRASLCVHVLSDTEGLAT